MLDGFSQRLRQIRQDMDLTATAMAERVGLGDRKSWENYERGSSTPRVETLSHIAAMGIDLNWLLTGKGNMRLIADTAAPTKESHVEPETLEAALIVIDEFAEARGLALSREQRAKLVSMLYDLYAIREQGVASDTAYVAQLFRMVAGGGR